LFIVRSEQRCADRRLDDLPGASFGTRHREFAITMPTLSPGHANPSPPARRFFAALVTAALLATAGCARQVCACAVYVGGTTPANDAEQASRRDAVSQCLARHGGGTIRGCPMPAGMAPPAR
jgi:hypothetical protein